MLQYYPILIIQYLRNINFKFIFKTNQMRKEQEVLTEKKQVSAKNETIQMKKRQNLQLSIVINHQKIKKMMKKRHSNRTRAKKKKKSLRLRIRKQKTLQLNQVTIKQETDRCLGNVLDLVIIKDVERPLETVEIEIGTETGKI
jgi:hypothetical protein